MSALISVVYRFPVLWPGRLVKEWVDNIILQEIVQKGVMLTP